MKVCITGGHLSPALATIEELRLRHPDWKFFWIGRNKALAGDTEESQESVAVKGLGISFYPLYAGRLNRMFSVETFLWALYIPFGFIQAFILCMRETPSIIVSFGGYIALPVVVAGRILGIPIVSHEQTRSPGLANKIIAFFVRKMCVSFPEMEQAFSSQKVICTGLPLRRDLLSKKNNTVPFKRADKPLLYIGGGTTGSLSMNGLVFDSLSSLLEDFQVVHQTGSQSYEKAIEIKNLLPDEKQENYIPLKYIETEVLSKVYKECSMYMGRSGANSVYELAVFGIPSIFIPLPWSSRSEQEENAKYVEKCGGAIVLDQNALHPEQVPEIVRSFYANISRYKMQMIKISPLFPRDGASRYADVIEEVCLYK